MKKVILLFNCLLTLSLQSQTTLRAPRVSFDVFHAEQRGYTPWNLSAEFPWNRYISLQTEIGWFRDRKGDNLMKPGISTQPLGSSTWSSTGNLFSDLFLNLLDYGSFKTPPLGKIVAPYNHQGMYLGLSPRFYLTAPEQQVRLFFQPQLLLFRYRSDIATITRDRAPGSGDLRTSTEVQYDVRQSTATFRASGGMLVRASKHFILEAGLSLSNPAVNRKARSQRDDFQLPEWLVRNPEKPVPGFFDLYLKAGYAF